MTIVASGVSTTWLNASHSSRTAVPEPVPRLTAIEGVDSAYDDLHERVAWEPYIPEGLPEEDPAWVLKVHETSGALLGIVRLLDATFLPDKPHWEQRPEYDVILWSAPEVKPMSATGCWSRRWWGCSATRTEPRCGWRPARERGSALLYGPLDLTPAAALDPSRLLAVQAPCRGAHAQDQCRH